MVTPNQLKTTIEQALPGATVKVQDYTGTSDHYQVLVVAAQFEGKNMVEQHQLVYGPLREKIGANEIHALSLKTLTPAEWEKSE